MFSEVSTSSILRYLTVIQVQVGRSREPPAPPPQVTGTKSGLVPFRDRFKTVNLNPLACTSEAIETKQPPEDSNFLILNLQYLPMPQTTPHRSRTANTSHPHASPIHPVSHKPLLECSTSPALEISPPRIQGPSMPLMSSDASQSNSDVRDKTSLSMASLAHLFSLSFFSFFSSLSRRRLRHLIIPTVHQFIVVYPISQPQ